MRACPQSKRIFVRSIIVAALVASSPFVAARVVPAIVGEATMVIGQARLDSADGVSREVERGSPIREGDRIETGVGGHVHVRFIDNGRLSVRPSSRLQIENYSHSDQEISGSAIKFRLDEGTVRSITGAWGEAARERFRLNTPVAAIGVKGTDFIVKASHGTTSASVFSGAILLAPLAGGCQATVGPCQNGTEKLLTADMKGQMLELNRQNTTAQLVPVEMLAQGRRAVAPGENAGRSEKPLQNDVAHGDMGSEKTMASEARGNSVASSVIVASVPGVAILPPQVNQLVWGRWGDAFQGDSFSQTFEEARKNRESTVGNGVYGLFRDSAAVAMASPAQSEGVANFRLASGAARYVGEGRLAEAARVEGGSLSVDFSRATFATQLNVSSPSIGNDNVKAAGVVLDSGVFQARTGNAYVAGALSNDRKEAGYFFEKALSSGNLTGVTLWGR